MGHSHMRASMLVGVAVVAILLGVIAGLLPYLGSALLAFVLMLFFMHMNALEVVVWSLAAAAGQFAMGYYLANSKRGITLVAVFFVVCLLVWVYDVYEQVRAYQEGHNIKF